MKKNIKSEEHLMIDAIMHGEIDAVRDGPNTKSRYEIEKQAREVCEQTETYVAMYMRKQEDFRKDITLHEKEMKVVHDCGGFDRYFLYIRSLTIEGIKQAKERI